MKLTILSFDWKKIEHDKVVSITLMTKIWEITVLNDHEPLLTSIKPSTMYYVYLDKNNVKQRDDIAIWNWFVEISNSKVKVMIDMLIDIEDLDFKNLERAKLDAQKIMDELRWSDKKIDMDKFIEAEDALLKSIAWLKLYDIKK